MNISSSDEQHAPVASNFARATPRLWGMLAILLASLIWAIEPVLAKLALRQANFLETSMVRAMFIAGVGLLYALASPPHRLGISRRQLTAIGYIALAGTLCADLLYIYALTRVPVMNAVLLGHMQPLFILLLGFFLRRTDHLSKNDYTGIAIILLAGILVTTRTMANLSQFRLGTSGDLLLLLATFAWATTALVARQHLAGVNAGIITFYRFLLAGLAFSLYLLAHHAWRINNGYQVALGLLVGVGCVLYYEGLARLPAAVVGSLELTTPFFSALFSFMILGEFITPLQLLGMLLLVSGIYFLMHQEKDSC
jgi:drug/metabolite transporter (DMT)-like permease